jgi:flagellar motor switch protein FliN/FliY
MSSDESNEKMGKQEMGSSADTNSTTSEGEAAAEEAAPATAEEEAPSEEEAVSVLEADPVEEETPLSEVAPAEGENDQELDTVAETQSVSDDPFSEERIQRILDIELPVNISFGSAKRPLSEVLKLGPGALLELDRVAEEPVVLKVNDRVFAKGEIVDVDGYYGVQITEISSPAQRIASLGD